jgi:hypothetical protein
MIWAQPGGTVAQVGFKLTMPHASPTRDRGAVMCCIPAGLASRRMTVADVRDQDHSLSLSASYKKEKVNRSFLLRCHFSPNAEVRTTSARCQVATDWHGHWAIPFA